MRVEIAYDYHTRCEALKQVKMLINACPKGAIVDRRVESKVVHVAAQKCGVTQTLERRRSAIGHLKMDSRLTRCVRKGTLGVVLHAVLYGSVHAIRFTFADSRPSAAKILAVFDESGGFASSRLRMKALAAC